jgi:hypothetical protein
MALAMLVQKVPVNDTMTGGMGADMFYGGSGNDDITFSEGGYISWWVEVADIFTLEFGRTNGTITDGGDGGETTDDEKSADTRG